MDPNLAAVLESLSSTLSKLAKPTEETKVAFKTPQMRAPDAFDGTQPSKLWGFLQSCQLIFHNDDKNFATDRKKVLYAVSYLSGRAEKWIEPYLSHLDDMDPTYILNSWTNFKSQLYTLFGDPHEVRKAESDLDNLQMKDGAQASSYITEFRSLTAQIGDWGDRAYMHHFRKGLPSRILDQIAVYPSPIDNLQKLMDVTLDLDVRHHERQKEKRSHTGSTNPSSTTQSSTSHSSTIPTSSKSRKKKFKPQPSSTPSNSTGYSKPALKLNSSGKVRREEKERR